MPFKVVNRQILSKEVKRVDILAPQIARKILPGQFVLVSIHPDDDRLSFTVSEVDANRGSIALIFQENSPALQQLGQLQINDEVHMVSGPFGNPIEIKKEGFVALVADGLGVADILPAARAFKLAGNKVLTFMGAPNKAQLILQSQMRLASYKIFMATQDGSWERKGLASNALADYLKKEKVDLIYTAGSPELMQAVAETTREKGIRTLARLNPVMFDATGVCGSCRVIVGGKTRFACTEGPVFNAHEVDFEDYKIRLKTYGEFAWDNSRLQSSQKNDGSGTFGKFLSGILKS